LFALSGFFLWRGPAAEARDPARPRLRVGAYLRRRAARILPAYWVVVTTVLSLLPGAGGSFTVWWANLTLSQVFVPLTLTTGLTQLWSLSVEAAFYLALPLFALAMAALRGPRARLRAPLIACAALLCLGWAAVPISTAGGVRATNWLPGYLPWFGVGMALAECHTDRPAWFSRLASMRGPLWGLAALAFVLAAAGPAGPVGLAAVSPRQFSGKVALGAVAAAGLLTPLITGSPRLLAHPAALALGRWSYGVFLWHVAVLAVVFPVFGILPFHGDFVEVLMLTVAFTVPLAAAGYGLVEVPARRAIQAGRPAAAQPTSASASSAGAAAAAEPPR
jgi:peptidoglycan/LPS O-acetylase OafA/YrhL